MSAIVRCLNKRGVIHGFINTQWSLTAELFFYKAEFTSSYTDKLPDQVQSIEHLC